MLIRFGKVTDSVRRPHGGGYCELPYFFVKSTVANHAKSL
jgi:hypothetical protein